MDRQEALHVIKSNWPTGRHQLSEALQTLIPEFSEPKKTIQEVLLHFLNNEINNLQSQVKEENSPKLKFLKEAYNWVEQQCEQKPTNKVEPKFKAGDWVVYKENVYQIHNTSLKKYYECLRIDGTVHTFDFEYIDSKSHLWTIQDAKDGDIVASYRIIILFKKFQEESDCNYIIAYAGIDISGKLQITDGHWLISNNAKPATKEQRELLFSKMNEEGYKWDVEKKELKKIEQKPVWSKEDENILNEFIESLRYCNGNGYNKQIDWLKSLKERMKGE